MLVGSTTVVSCSCGLYFCDNEDNTCARLFLVGYILCIGNNIAFVLMTSPKEKGVASSVSEMQEQWNALTPRQVICGGEVCNGTG
jgi:hypothetical protein